ncbi:hypothetical protein [Sporosarcina sp. E16_8]|uniref:hypothetical protein n=1 Tax=Sporosarcina sp. E16_8 TaxID=2789295 RepID=UPI001A914EA9|nr:hypothetical protein [Sporosarcina sp. E16_8]MBO0587709.1 hypothetical protein [Sporosarcina sp. E16_8]
MDIIKDLRVNCYSLMIKMKIEDYLKYIDFSYKHQGNLGGQRAPLKTKSATAIRKRMQQDIIDGTVLPPVVIGIKIGENNFSKIEEYIQETDYEQLKKRIFDVDPKNISIIDGMQRTTSIMEASEIHKEVLERELRVEFWIAKSMSSLIYRMLILNTGQIPWNLKRQMETVYNPLLKEIEEKVEKLNVIEVDEGTRRTSAGIYQGDKVIELFLVFGAREAKVDAKEALADEFTRLDFIKATSKNDMSDFFAEFLKLIIEFDEIVFPLSFEESVNKESHFKYGKDLFASQTLKAGFIAAIAQRIFGLPGEDYSKERYLKNYETVRMQFIVLLEKLRSMEEEQLKEFIDIMTLNESIIVNKGIGDFQRKFFTRSFELLLNRNFDLDSLTPCWRVGR